ncbi:MAG: lysyl oxidase family protein [Candidatus Limnocylindrales bacterium]
MSASIVASLMLPLAAASPALGAASDLLPDMKMAPIYGIQLTTSAHGRKKLRFGTIAFNVGDGPMEVRARGRDGREMTNMAQWIHRSDGTGHRIPKPGARMFFQGDGHDHWHVERFFTMTLKPLSGSDPTPQRRIHKIGFCLVDAVPMPGRHQPSNAARYPAYFDCGEPDSRRVKVGVSVGWGDDYPPDFAFQSINVTGLPSGDYRLCATVNPVGLWTEKGDNRANNSYWLDMELDPDGDTLAVTNSGDTSCS